MSLYRFLTACGEKPVLWTARWLERTHPDAAPARRGDLPGSGSSVWFHAASAGEMRGLVPLIRRRRGPHLVTAHTAAGTSAARQLLPGERITRAPFDLPRVAARAFATSGVRTLVLAETELWPNWLEEAARRSVAVVLVNARISDRSRPRYLRFLPFWRPRLARLAAVAAQTETDAERLIELGARPKVVAVTGSMKHDLPAGEIAPEAHPWGDDPIVVLGSLRPGEEDRLARALVEVRRSVPGLRVVAAPRHAPHRPAVAQAFARRGFRVGRRSAGAPAADHDLLLLDTMGELPGFYAVARVAFVGGTLVPIGGHNVAEPALCGTPVIHGPSVANCRAEAEALAAGEGSQIARSDAELVTAFRAWLEAPDRRARASAGASRAIERLKGATDRTLAHLGSLGLLLDEET